MIESLNKRGCISEYVQGNKQEREGSSKINLPREFLSLALALRIEKLANEKHPYIFSITGGTPRSNPYSKGTVKSKIVDLKAVYKGGGNSLLSTSNRAMMGLQDSEKVKGVCNELFPLVIINTLGQFDVS